MRTLLPAQPGIYFNVDEAAQTVRIVAVLYKPRETAYRRGRKVETRE